MITSSSRAISILTIATRSRLAASKNIRKMSFHFASTEYAKCFLDLPQPDLTALRQQAIHYLDNFDSQLWYDDPMTSLLKGEALGGSAETVTVNALGSANGKQIMASSEQVRKLTEHIRTFVSPYTDLRKEMRMIEQTFLNEYAGFLIGNQCIDFQKQDGVTEIEEAIMANAVERRLNDMLMAEESTNVLHVDRRPIYVTCVSNFSNFLDLFRKSIRSLEVGVPIVVLGRSNTAQHCFRWTRLLVDLMSQQGINPGMVTFLCCSLDDIKEILRSCQDQTGNLYTTCSRELATTIKSEYPCTVASTGGPNTLVTTELNDAVKKAVQMSASIESSGQCTALRHCVVPPETNEAAAHSVFDSIKSIDDACQALKSAIFDGVFAEHKGSATPNVEGYKHCSKADAYFKIDDKLPEKGINEWWRRVVIDFSKLDIKDSENLQRLAVWLNLNQPISLAVNGQREEAIKLGLELFNKTGLVVNTIGSTDDEKMQPALTCQARPQEAEIFGEFPPRSTLSDYTRFPVVVPSSNPSYGATYTEIYLNSQKVPHWFGDSTKMLLGEMSNLLITGYCVTLIKYLQDVARYNPKPGFGKSRTVLWGIQRPPLGTQTILHCSKSVKWDCVCPIYILFYATNAREQVIISVDPVNQELINLCDKYRLPHVVETRGQLNERIIEQANLVFNTVLVEPQPMTSFPMAGNFVSLYFPLGHIKSTMANDQQFALLLRLSEKWLNTLF